MKNLSFDEQVVLARLIMNLLDDWGVGDSDKVILLGMPEGTKARHLTRYRQDTPLPDAEEVRVRVEHFIGIADALRLANPLNAQGGVMWMQRRNRRFNGRTPLDIMLEDGLRGIAAVRRNIDCSYDWFVDGQQAKQ